jgi:4-hydroxy-2-oxoglutarate aldolase
MALQGVFPPIATPFDAQGRLDRAALAANVARWNQAGLHGYVVAGSNGESVLLEQDEVAEAVRVVRAAAGLGRLVIAGTGCQSTSATVRLTRAAAVAGAHFALVMTPSFYANEMSEAAMIRHYETVAAASPIPVLVYNVPKFTHYNITPATVARIAALPNIVGIKDSAGDVPQLGELVRLAPTGFDVVAGHGGAFVAGLRLGTKGGILAVANVAPRECVAMFVLAQEGRYDEAQAISDRIAPVTRAVTTGFGVPGLKAALDLLGYQGGAPRPPLLPLDAAKREELRQILHTAGLL